MAPTRRIEIVLQRKHFHQRPEPKSVPKLLISEFLQMMQPAEAWSDPDDAVLQVPLADAAVSPFCLSTPGNVFSSFLRHLASSALGLNTVVILGGILFEKRAWDIVR